MRFGVCCSYSQFETVKNFGYDYIESNFSNLATISDEEFEKIAEASRKTGLKSETCNGAFPADAPICGPDADLSFLPSYLETGFSRAEKLGCEIVVIGSGKARNIPEGFEREKGVAQFCELLDICGTTAARYGIKIAVEPLNSRETNLVNTVADSLAICRQVNNPHVGVLADFFHVFKSEESLEALKRAGDRLFHIHLARANDDRHIPTEEDAKICKIWADALKSAGYNGRISLEGRFYPDFITAVDKVRPVLKLFQSLESAKKAYAGKDKL